MATALLPSGMDEHMGTTLIRSLEALGRLEEALELLVGGFSDEVRSNALQRARELKVEQLVSAVDRGLREGGVEAWVEPLSACAGVLIEVVSERLRAAWLRACLSVAWSLKESPTMEQFLRAVSPGEEDPGSAAYFHLTRQLLRGYRELAGGSPGTAIAVSRTVADQEDLPEDLMALALELRADAFRELGDVEREAEARREWAALFGGRPGGPCAAASEHSLLAEDEGVVRARRGEEMLSCYARLGELLEGLSDLEGARCVYEDFLRWGYHGWVDPRRRAAGTIRERLVHLGVGGQVDPAAVAGPQTVVVHAPRLTFGRLAEGELEALNAMLRQAPASEVHVVLGGRLELRNNRFGCNGAAAAVHDELVAAITEAASRNGSTGLCLRAWHADARQTGEVVGEAPWVFVEHQVAEPGLAPVIFAIRPVVVGAQVEIAIWGALRAQPWSGSELIERLGDLIEASLGNVVGYATLCGPVVGVIQKACGWLASRTTGEDREDEP